MLLRSEMEGAPAAEDDAQDDNTVVVISSDRMGTGNDELGKVLIKGFIFAVTQLDKLPKTMLFYNGGATLTTEGSDSLEDLKSLEAQGVEIMTCGTCLDYYGLKDKLAVGSVTNSTALLRHRQKQLRSLNHKMSTAKGVPRCCLGGQLWNYRIEMKRGAFCCD